MWPPVLFSNTIFNPHELNGTTESVQFFILGFINAKPGFLSRLPAAADARRTRHVTSTLSESRGMPAQCWNHGTGPGAGNYMYIHVHR